MHNTGIAAEPLKALTTQPDDQCSIIRTHIVRENKTGQVPTDIYTVLKAHAEPHIYTKHMHTK